MEIEIKKVRVTKSIIKQMPIADITVLKHGKVLGIQKIYTEIHITYKFIRRYTHE